MKESHSSSVERIQLAEVVFRMLGPNYEIVSAFIQNSDELGSNGWKGSLNRFPVTSARYEDDRGRSF